MTHAFFKALLFLAAGSVIVALHHEQDIRRMGGLRRHMPITYWTSLVGSLALIGFPGFSGFFSKDALIEAVEALHHSRLHVRIHMPDSSACSSRRCTRFECSFSSFTARNDWTRTPGIMCTSRHG